MALRESITIDIFDKESIKKALKSIKNYERVLKDKLNIFINRLARLGIETAKIIARSGNVPNEIINSLKLKPGDSITNGKQIIIVCDNENAIYWEYGTGVVGQSNPYPETIDWEYDINKHGLKGWTYTTDGGKTWHHTRGIKSKQFMLNAYNEMIKEVANIAKEVFNE